MPRVLAAVITFLLVVLALPAMAQNPAERIFAIVEYNTAMRPPRKDTPSYADEATIRKLKLEDEQLDTNERRYVAAKISDWKKRLQIPDADVELLYPAGTGLYVIEATRDQLQRIIIDAARDGFVNIMLGSELLEFEMGRLNSIFNTPDLRLVGEFLNAHFKHEILFSVWNAANVESHFAQQTELQQTMAKGVAGASLEKLDTLRQFLMKRGERHYKALFQIQQISRQILNGYIAIEAMPTVWMQTTQSTFFESLEFFNSLGVQILLTNSDQAERIFDRWLKFQSVALELPEYEGRVEPVHSGIMRIFGHQTAWLRDQAMVEFTNMILDFENGQHIRTSGIPDERIVRVALRIAQSQEELELSASLHSAGVTPLDRVARTKRRYEIAESLIRNSIPNAEVRLDRDTEKPSRLLIAIVGELFRLDLETNRLGSNFSTSAYRRTVMQILNILLHEAKNETFQRRLQDQANDWFSQLRTSGQDGGLQQPMQILERKMVGINSRLCRELFQSAP